MDVTIAVGGNTNRKYVGHIQHPTLGYLVTKGLSREMNLAESNII
jgi:hypothetical protein